MTRDHSPKTRTTSIGDNWIHFTVDSQELDALVINFLSAKRDAEWEYAGAGASERFMQLGDAAAAAYTDLCEHLGIRTAVTTHSGDGKKVYLVRVERSGGKTLLSAPPDLLEAKEPAGLTRIDSAEYKRLRDKALEQMGAMPRR